MLSLVPDLNLHLAYHRLHPEDMKTRARFKVNLADLARRQWIPLHSEIQQQSNMLLI